MTDPRTVELRIKSTTRRDRDALLVELRTLYGARLRTKHVPDQAQRMGDGMRWIGYVEIVITGAVPGDLSDADFARWQGE